jgi:hypothetical protein
MPWYSTRFDSRYMDNATGITTIFIEHPKEFLELCERGAHGGSLEEQEQQYQVLKEEVEKLIDRFKSLLVSEEFL